MSSPAAISDVSLGPALARSISDLGNNNKLADRSSGYNPAAPPPTLQYADVFDFQHSDVQLCVSSLYVFT
jgi:hypothetical protein